MSKLVRFAALKPEHGIPFTRQHIARKAAAGTFPSPVHLGPGTIAWPEEDILEYKRRLVAERDAHSTAWRDAGGTDAAPAA